MFQVDHEQRPALRNDVVLVARVTEYVLEPGACQTVHRVDDDLQSVAQGFGVCGILQIWFELPVEHLPRGLVIPVLDRHSSIHQVREVLGVWSEEVKSPHRVGVHGLYIQHHNVLIHAWLRVHVSALAGVLASIFALSEGILVPREQLGQVRVHELRLRVLDVTEYDLAGV